MVKAERLRARRRDLCRGGAARGGHPARGCGRDGGRELRLHFPDTPLLVMGALTAEELGIALAAGAEIAVWREGFRELCSRVAAELGRPARVHVKLDSGMGRLGERDPRGADRARPRIRGRPAT